MSFSNIGFIENFHFVLIDNTAGFVKNKKAYVIRIEDKEKTKAFSTFLQMEICEKGKLELRKWSTSNFYTHLGYTFCRVSLFFFFANFVRLWINKIIHLRNA